MDVACAAARRGSGGCRDGTAPVSDFATGLPDADFRRNGLYAGTGILAERAGGKGVRVPDEGIGGKRKRGGGGLEESLGNWVGG